MTSSDPPRKKASEILAEIDLLSYMVRDGVRVDPGRRTSPHHRITWCICPVHAGGNERHGSLAVYDDGHFFCYGGCNRGGNLFSYVMWRNGLGPEEYEKAREIVTGEQAKRPYQKPVPVDPSARKVYIPTMDEVSGLSNNFHLVEKYVRSRSIPSHLSEIRMLGGRRLQRRFTDTTGQLFPLEYNQVAIPYIFDNEPYSINFRRDDSSCIEWMGVLSTRYGMDFIDYLKIDYAEYFNEKQKRLGREGEISPSEVSLSDALDYAFGPRFYKPAGTRGSAYGVNWFVRRENGKLIYNKLPYGFVAEGEFDELSGSALHFPALANKIPKSGHTATSVDLRRLLQGVTQIYVAMDNNESGRAYAEGTFKALGSDRSRVRFVRFPEEHGDMNAMLQANLLEDFVTGRPLYLDPMPYMV